MNTPLENRDPDTSATNVWWDVRLHFQNTREQITSALESTPPNQDGSEVLSQNKHPLQRDGAPTRNMKECDPFFVSRQKEVTAIGDLHGSLEALKGNFEYAGLIDNKDQWTATNREIVLHGDILADRNTESFAIIEKLLRYAQEAQAQNSTITVLAGNHEDIAFAYLTWEKVPNFYKGASSDIEWIDYSEFWPSDGLMEFQEFWNNPAEILANMRASKKWRSILEFMCQLKLIEYIDDSLFVHVVPSREMLAQLERWPERIKEINNLYQTWLRAFLLGTREVFSKEAFDYLRCIFLSTDSRKIVCLEHCYDTLHANGINHIFFGHDSETADRGNIEIGKMILIGTDYQYKARPNEDKYPSVVTMKGKGIISSPKHQLGLFNQSKFNSV